MKTLYFDCFCGASGDMIVGSLIDVGADFHAIREALASLPLKGFDVQAEKVKKKGIAATQFLVKVDEGVQQPHRHLRHVVEIIRSGSLPQKVSDAACETFELLAEAEAAVHATTVEKVHFHEVGAIDSIVDIVSAQFGLYLLEVDEVFASPLRVGYGTVECDHGVMPVPAPATALLLKGIPWSAGDVAMELLTPTGAALLKQVAREFRPMFPMLVHAVGYGSGSREIADRANVLRVFLGERDGVARERQQVVLIETNIDDMSPELVAPVVGQLLENGAYDAFYTSVLGKKGRIGFLITVICDPEKTEQLARVLLRYTSTFGVRIRQEERICLEREWKVAKTPWGNIRVKIGKLGEETTSRSPEFEDCRLVANRSGRPLTEVYQAAVAAAVRGELSDGEE